MATEKLPFEAPDDMESLLKVQKADFPPPEKVKPTVGPAVAGIIMRAMRLAPSERYQSADEMLVDVERVLRTEVHSAGQNELQLWLVRRPGAGGGERAGAARCGACGRRCVAPQGRPSGSCGWSTSRGATKRRRSASGGWTRAASSR